MKKIFFIILLVGSLRADQPVTSDSLFTTAYQMLVQCTAEKYALNGYIFRLQKKLAKKEHEIKKLRREILKLRRRK